MRPAWFAAAALITLAACGGKPRPVVADGTPKPRDDGGTDVSLTAEDGVRLAATHWAGPADNERCVVFVHQLGSTREEWAPLIFELRGRYELLAIDLRGHGGSTRGPTGALDWRGFDAAAWAAADRDLEAAMAFLADRGFVDAGCVFFGSSIGSSLVVRYAGRHVDTAGIVLLSPGLDYHDLEISDAAAAYHHPALIVYSEEPGPIETVAALEPLWPDVQLLQVGGDAHGLPMIDQEPAMLDAVVGFVEGVLSP